jgi:hypothetical protein
MVDKLQSLGPTRIKFTEIGSPGRNACHSTGSVRTRILELRPAHAYKFIFYRRLLKRKLHVSFLLSSPPPPRLTENELPPKARHHPLIHFRYRRLGRLGQRRNYLDLLEHPPVGGKYGLDDAAIVGWARQGDEEPKPRLVGEL